MNLLRSLWVVLVTTTGFAGGGFVGYLAGWFIAGVPCWGGVLKGYCGGGHSAPVVFVGFALGLSLGIVTGVFSASALLRLNQKDGW